MTNPPSAIDTRCLGAYWIILFLLALVVQQIAVPVVFGPLQKHGILLGEDVLTFHKTATEIAERIRERGWHEWKPKPFGWGNVGISSALYALFGAHPVVLVPVSAFFLAAAFSMLQGCLVRFGVPQRLAWLAPVPIFFLPTTLFVLTQWHKDVVAVPATVAIIFGCVIAATDRRRVLGLLAIATGTAGLCLVREHLVLPIGIACLGGTFVAAAAIPWKQAGHRTGWAALFACTALLILAANVLPNWTTERASTEWPTKGSTEVLTERLQFEAINSTSVVAELIDRQFFAISTIRASAQQGMAHGASGLDNEVVLNSTIDIITYFPRALIIAALAPFPNQWIQEDRSGGGRLLRLLSGLEMSFVYTAYVGLVAAAWRWGRSPYFWFLLSSSTALLLLHGLIFVNAGTLMRVRYAFLIVPILMGTAGWLALFAPCLKTLKRRILIPR